MLFGKLTKVTEGCEATEGKVCPEAAEKKWKPDPLLLEKVIIVNREGLCSGLGCLWPHLIMTTFFIAFGQLL